MGALGSFFADRITGIVSIGRITMRHFAIFIYIIAFCLGSSELAFAISDAEYKSFMETSEKFAEAENLLNSTWKQIKETLPPEQYDTVLREQRAWNKARDAEALAAQRDGHADSLADCYALGTEERARVLKKILSSENGSDSQDIEKKSITGVLASEYNYQMYSEYLCNEEYTNGNCIYLGAIRDLGIPETSEELVFSDSIEDGDAIRIEGVLKNVEGRFALDLGKPFSISKIIDSDKEIVIAQSNSRVILTGYPEIYQEVGMWFFRLNDDKGNEIEYIGAMGTLPENSSTCLQEAVDNNQQVKINVTYIIDGAKKYIDEYSVLCTIIN